jgi:hypothetical protein
MIGLLCYKYLLQMFSVFPLQRQTWSPLPCNNA